MTFNKFLATVGGRLTQLKKRNVSGVMTIACEIQRGRAERGQCRFLQQPVLRRTESEHDSPSKMLQDCYTEAQQQESQFYGRIEIQYFLFDGIVVDSRREIKQTFVFTA